METFIIRERESKKEIKRFTDGNEAMKELRRMANQKKEENADDWNFYEMITKREKDLERSDIKIYSKNDGTTSTEVTADTLSGSYIIPRLDDKGDLNTIKVAVNTTDEKYTDVRFTITSTISQIIYNLSTKEVLDSMETEFKTDEFDAGKYQLTVIANTKNSTNREQQFIIEIQ